MNVQYFALIKFDWLKFRSAFSTELSRKTEPAVELLILFFLKLSWSFWSYFDLNVWNVLKLFWLEWSLNNNPQRALVYSSGSFNQLVHYLQLVFLRECGPFLCKSQPHKKQVKCFCLWVNLREGPGGGEAAQVGATLCTGWSNSRKQTKPQKKGDERSVAKIYS